MPLIRYRKDQLKSYLIFSVKYPEPRQLICFPINMEEATEEQKAGIRLLRYEPNSSFSIYLYVRQDCLNFVLFQATKKDAGDYQGRGSSLRSHEICQILVFVPNNFVRNLAFSDRNHAETSRSPC
jgi:hypothetical protein